MKLYDDLYYFIFHDDMLFFDLANIINFLKNNKITTTKTTKDKLFTNLKY
jgi:hypothetical protein